MNPAPSVLVWEGLKQGIIIWPIAVKPGEYFALPIYLVAPLLLIVLGIVAVGIHFMSTARRERPQE